MSLAPVRASDEAAAWKTAARFALAPAVLGMQKKWSLSLFVFVPPVPGQPRELVEGWVAALASMNVAVLPLKGPEVSGQRASLEPSRPNPMVKTSTPAVLAAVAAALESAQ